MFRVLVEWHETRKDEDDADAEGFTKQQREALKERRDEGAAQRRAIKEAAGEYVSDEEDEADKGRRKGAGGRGQRRERAQDEQAIKDLTGGASLVETTQVEDDFSLKMFGSSQVSVVTTTGMPGEPDVIAEAKAKARKDVETSSGLAGGLGRNARVPTGKAERTLQRLLYAKKSKRASKVQKETAGARTNKGQGGKTTAKQRRKRA